MINQKPVDLVVNSYERTYRDVLTPGAFRRICADNPYPFARRVALVNNVDDREDVRRRAQRLIAAGELDELEFVSDHVEAGLAVAGLTWADLGEIPYFTDWALAAIALPGPDWMVHWDPELRMREPSDWISPSIALIESDPRVIAANPGWGDLDDLDRHTCERTGAFSLGHGFSDQVFLARRSTLAQPIYQDRTLARLRFPVAHLGDIFEARIDSHIRRRGLLRATYRPATYTHAVEIGAAYPRRSFGQTVRFARNRAITIALPKIPRALRPPTLKLL